MYKINIIVIFFISIYILGFEVSLRKLRFGEEVTLRNHVLSRKINVKSIDRNARRLIFKFFPDASVDVQRVKGLLEKLSGSITPQGVLSFQLAAQGEEKIMTETISILKELS